MKNGIEVFKDQTENLRRISRLPQNEQEVIFALSEEDYDLNLSLLNSGNNELVSNALEMFLRHYSNNGFEDNDKSHFIITVAVSILNSNENVLTNLTKNAFDLIFNVIKKPVNGLSFILSTNILEILGKNIINTASPFFDKSIISIAIIASQSSFLCGKIYKILNDIKFFFHIMQIYDPTLNYNVPIHITWILYYYTKNECLVESQYLQMIEFLINSLNTFHDQISSQIEIESYRFVIFSISLKILKIIFAKSLNYRSYAEENYNFTQQFISIFNYIIHLNPKASPNVSKIISDILDFITVLHQRPSLDSQGINVPRIVHLIKTSDLKVQIASTNCIIRLINDYPESAPIYIESKIRSSLHKIFCKRSFKAKIKALKIIELIMMHGSREDQIAMSSPCFVSDLLDFAKESDDTIYLKIIQLLSSMLYIEKMIGKDLSVKSTIMCGDGILTLEEKTMNGSEGVSVKSLQLIKDYLDDG